MPEPVYLQAAQLRARFSVQMRPTRCIWLALSTIDTPRCGPTTTAWCKRHMG
jgi:hypothetical protein